MGVLEDKAFHIVLITKGNVDDRLYFEKIRDIIFENIAFTLIIKYHKMSHVNLNKFLNELRSKPHEVIEA
ncbi:MAG: hypothetical protein B6U75_03325 [Desulfurococcales archaeon ex4484_217_1]|nr:MAG: hypothetical protein B6U75_03325 [Desulfurococcales archaeon ex4484_217_1]